MNLSILFDVFTRILINDFLRYFITAGIAFLIFWIFLRERLQHRFIQKKFPKTKRLWFEFRYSMSTVLIFALNGAMIFALKNTGFTLIYADISTYGWAYAVLSFVLSLVYHDTYFYWTHRFMHLPRIYPHVHKVHHRSTNPSPWAAYSFHPYEAIIQALGFTMMLFIIPLHPLVLFLFLLNMITRDVLGHIGFELFPKGFTRQCLLNWNTTSTHHNLHHRYFKYNYGLYFSWWDNLMDTTHPAYHNTFDEVKERSPNHDSHM